MTGGAVNLINEKCIMIIFGGTGDLAHRKLVPAIYNMHLSGQLPESFALLGTGRKQKSHKQYRHELAVSAKKYSSQSFKEKQWETLAGNIYYHDIDLQDNTGYQRLKETLKALSPGTNSEGNILYYLALAPQLFSPVSTNLKRNKLNASPYGWRRLLIEKPFGYNLASARELNTVITEAFSEENIYRIDHYLGKEMLQNILVLRFVNCIFEPLWNNNYIDNIQITASETDGIGTRGRYYDLSGAMRDMVQSHLFQMLALTAIEPPAQSDPHSVHMEKLNLLKTIQLWPDSPIEEKIVFGQYNNFRAEQGVSPDSKTETFSALKLTIDNDRWRGVPVYLRTGKNLGEKIAKIVIQFKVPSNIDSHILPGSSLADRSDLPNLLTLKVQPREGVVFQFNIKKPATMGEIVPVEMDFCQPCAFLINTPEAYERLLTDAIMGDKTRFTGWNEIECAWSIVDNIYQEYNKAGAYLHQYEPGSNGPQAAIDMLSRDNRRWWE
ncbi:MAG: glucose-6-phosphate dehydrogenase [Firmicutes bacterium]|nr:glucose-6-phosphate dehydrogenase [Bacillota bacterium]